MVKNVFGFSAFYLGKFSSFISVDLRISFEVPVIISFELCMTF